MNAPPVVNHTLLSLVHALLGRNASGWTWKWILSKSASFADKIMPRNKSR